MMAILQTPRRKIIAVLGTAILGVAIAAASGAVAQNVLRIAAVVNDRIVSAVDVVDRMRLVMATSRLPNTAETRKKLTPQIIRSLIDEEIQLQEASQQNIRVREREIDKRIKFLEKQNNMPAGRLAIELKNMGVNISTLRGQFKAQIAWSKTVSRRLRREVQINAEDIDDELALIRRRTGQPRYRVSEIFLTVDNIEQENRIRGIALRLLEQLREGANFSSLARAFSQSTSASLGGDLGWILTGRLDQNLDDAIVKMKKGEFSEPIRSFAGFHILNLKDIRKPAGKDSVIVELRQIVLRQDTSSAFIAKTSDIRRDIKGCENFDAAKTEIGAPESGALGKMKLSELPQNLRDGVRNLDIGVFSEPMTAASGATVLLIVCDRQQPGVKLPKRAAIRKQLLTRQLERMSQRYLRDLRRNAFIDIRN
ncbi:MAG: peptidylprolyl isomerase [Alphaproteobacteria bacterium]|nr:peptidylprolyl isomerase [Alphaproteobacteria bacterium]